MLAELNCIATSNTIKLGKIILLSTSRVVFVEMCTMNLVIMLSLFVFSVSDSACAANKKHSFVPALNMSEAAILKNGKIPRATKAPQTARTASRQTPRTVRTSIESVQDEYCAKKCCLDKEKSSQLELLLELLADMNNSLRYFREILESKEIYDEFVWAEWQGFLRHSETFERTYLSGCGDDQMLDFEALEQAVNVHEAFVKQRSLLKKAYDRWVVLQFYRLVEYLEVFKNFCNFSETCDDETWFTWINFLDQCEEFIRDHASDEVMAQKCAGLEEVLILMKDLYIQWRQEYEDYWQRVLNS